MRDQIKWIVLLAVLLLLIGYAAVFHEKVVEPNLIAIAEVRARSALTSAATEAVRSVLRDRNDLRELLRINTDAEGHVTSVETWALPMSQMGSDLSAEIQKATAEAGETQIDVPLGALLGSPVLSQTGLSARIRIKPLGTAKVTVKTEFEGEGINQTRYRVILHVSAQAIMLAPFSRETISVGNEYLIAEVIIAGDVPENYVVVPKDEVMDAVG